MDAATSLLLAQQELADCRIQLAQMRLAIQIAGSALAVGRGGEAREALASVPAPGNQGAAGRVQNRRVGGDRRAGFDRRQADRREVGGVAADRRQP